MPEIIHIHTKSNLYLLIFLHFTLILKQLFATEKQHTVNLHIWWDSLGELKRFLTTIHEQPL